MSGSNSVQDEFLDSIDGVDLNQDGKFVALIICGNSRFYNYGWIEEQLEQWVKFNGYPDVVILGGASGVDVLAERWADNNNIALRVFTEMWSSPRPNQVEDSGRPEATDAMGQTMIRYATHMLAFPGPKSKWTRRMIEIANENSINTVVIELPMSSNE
jgi:hypothetical protein